MMQSSILISRKSRGNSQCLKSDSVSSMELLDNHVRNPSFGNVVRQKVADANSPTRATASSVKLSRKNSVAKNTGPYSDASIYSIPSRAIPRNARKQIIVNEASDIYTDFMPQGFSDFPKPPEVSPSTSFTSKDKIPVVKPEVGQVKKPKRNKPTSNQTNSISAEPKRASETKNESKENSSQKDTLSTQTPTQKTPAARKAPEVPKRPPSDVIIPKIPPPIQKNAPPEVRPEVRPEVARKPKVIEIPRPEMVQMGEPEVKSDLKLQRAPSTKIRTKIVSTFEEMCLGLSSSEENLQAEGDLQEKPTLVSPSRENLISEETDVDCPEMPAKMEPIMPAGPFDSHVPEYISKPVQNDPFTWEDPKATFDIDPFETSDVFDNAIIQQMPPSKMATTTEGAAEQYAEIKRYDSQNSMISDAKSLRRNSSDFRERALSMKTDRTFDITEVTKMDFKCNISLSTDKFSEEMVDEVAYEEIQTDNFETKWPQNYPGNQGSEWPENTGSFELVTPPWPEMTIVPEPVWPEPPTESDIELTLPRLNASRPDDNLDTASISTEELDRKIELMMRKREKRINEEFVQATRSFERPVIVNEQFVKPVQIQPQPEMPDQVHFSEIF